MLKIITLGCVLLALLSAILTQSWLMARRGQGQLPGRVYSIISSRSTGFRRFQYVPVSAALVIIGVAVGMGAGWKRAAVFLVGAAVSCAASMIGSSAHVSGTTAAVYAISQGDMRTALKGSFRSGMVLGYCISSFLLTVLGGLFILFKTNEAVSMSCYLALGAAAVAIMMSVGGHVYSSSYALARDKDDPRDNTGNFAAIGSDLASTYLLSAAGVMLLADIGVATSGVTATFNVSSAAKFVLVIYAAGIVSSMIGSAFYRGGYSANSRSAVYRSSTVGCIVAVVITAAAAVVASMYMLQIRIYAYAAISGMVAAIAAGEISKAYSQDSKALVGRWKSDRRMGKYTPVMFNLGTGSASVIADGILVMAAVYVSYNFASYYGIALCAAGAVSVMPSMAAVGGLAITGGAAASMVDSLIEGDDFNPAADAMESAANNADICARSYTSITGLMAGISMFISYMHVAGYQTLNIISLPIMSGMILGSASAFLLLGSVISSVKLTGRAALGNLGLADEDSEPTGFVRGASIPAIICIAIPSVTGLLLGAQALAGFLLVSVLTGSAVQTALDRSGQYYERSASRSLGSLIRMMVVFSAALLPSFLKIGGFI